MEQLNFIFYAKQNIRRRAHIGVVGSGNLEILVEPCNQNEAQVEVTTSVEGNREIWKCVLERFFTEYPLRVRMEINDFGATPGIVSLRLLQVREECFYEDKD